MSIDLNSEHAIFRPPHKLGVVERDPIGVHYEKLATFGSVQRSTLSMYASTIVVVREEDEAGNYKDFRHCGGYCLLNRETSLDRDPLPGIGCIFNRVGGARIFIKLDLRSGYHWMPLQE